MKKTRNTEGEQGPGDVADDVEARIFRVMTVSVALAASIAALLAPWRITTGLLLGGALSLLNYRWLRTSVGAIIAGNASGKFYGGKSARYLLRYLVVAGAVIVAYKLKLVSLPASIFGLCSFVVALFAEAFREFYLTVIRREGIN